METKETNDHFIIEGLSGKRTLSGQIEISGAKNAALKVLASVLLFKNQVKLTNVPEIEDVTRMMELLLAIGVKIEKGGVGELTLDPTQIISSDICPKISKHLRASVVLSGPLLARTGKVSFPHPGGCVIGKRPIDFFLEGFTKMGAEIVETDLGYELVARDGLRGAEIFFRLPSVTGTETFMMAGVLAKGKTVIENSALEPEIVSLGEFLNSCGAQIEGLGTPTITISGGELLDGERAIYETIPDRIEAGSFLILATLAGKDLEITKLEPQHLKSLIHALTQAGVEMEIGINSIRVRDRQTNFKGLEIKTHEYPGFPTDLQAPMSVFLTQATGQSYIFETIFEGRLNYLTTLERMGAKTRIIDVHRAFIEGPTPLIGKEVESPDLRAGLAYVLAGIIASGSSIVHNVHYIDRGYEKLDERLRKVGVNIKRISQNAILDQKTGD